MELTIEQALQQGVAAHKEGKLQDAERLYRAILQSQPSHPDANHNLGVLAVSVHKADAALPLFKTALEANPKIEQFWLSYIDALIKEQQFDNAKQVLAQAKAQGVDEARLNSLEAQGLPKTEKPNTATTSPPQELLNSLLWNYQNGQFSDAEKLSIEITQDFPKHQLAWKVLGAVLGATGRKSKAVNANRKAVDLSPNDAEAHNNLGITLKEMGRLDEAKTSYTQAIALKPDYADAHNNFGNVLKDMGRLGEAHASFTKAIGLKPDYAEAHYNLGNTLEELGRLEKAEASYLRAITLKPRFTHAYWNAHGIQKSIEGAENWIDKCLKADPSHLMARLTKAALNFYKGDRSSFDIVMQSKFSQHPYTRSLSWAFSLPNLPDLHFNRWHFYDAMVKKSKISKPFYEFGVWRASSFKYLIKFFKKGYGFDTFSGLPEDWDVGSHLEKKGSYASDGNVPKIKGGEFIVGKFEDTLPIFFSERRPIASIINFDADLYSSTICALNFSKQIIDKNTILIFDEFIMNQSWEQDEFKALNEFCSDNHYTYEILAISFFTKQVALRLIGV